MTDLRSLYKLFEPALRPVGNAASFTDEDWTVRSAAGRTRVYARVRVTNEAGDREVMLHDIRVDAHLLSDSSLDGLSVRTDLRSLDPDYPPRTDRYWTAFVVKPHKYSEIEVEVDIEGERAADVYAVCIDLHVDTYGAEGLRPRVHAVVLPVRQREPEATLRWREAEGGLLVAPIRTHLLTPQDDPVEVAKRYVTPHARPGDVLTIGESPLAVMQHRFRHPAEIHVSPLTRRLCYFLSGQGSLGTATGLQALVDQVGMGKVVWALAKGLAGKAVGRDGDFYRTVGDQARLIDDVTGTLPPYDRFLVLGPDRPSGVSRDIQAATGLEVAIVDANDLGRVDVIGKTSGVRDDEIQRALRRNPAGNGGESTPLVLIRKSLDASE